MASYVPLRRQYPEEHDNESVVKDPLLPKDSFDIRANAHHADSRTKWLDWTVLILSILVLVSACMMYAGTSGLPAPRHARGLRKPDQYPGLDQLFELSKKRKGPMMVFPGTMVRANKAMPDRVYEKSPHIYLSDNDSMFYQWRLRSSTSFKWCYIDAVVPTLEAGIAANKTFKSSGSLTAIQVWNVTTPSERITSLSWNTRPERVSLLGTVAFLPDEERKQLFDLEDGWQLKPPTPRFPCGEKGNLTIEVACEGCTLEFDQIFSDPPLAFDLLEIG